MAFTRMDEGKIEDWMVIGDQVIRRQAAIPSIIKTMLSKL